MSAQVLDIIRRLNREERVRENGRIVMDGPVEVLRDNPDVKEFYLGLTEVGGRRSYREVKHYRRRKRWLS